MKGMILLAALLTPSLALAAPLLKAHNLQYMGAFRVPSGTFGGSSFSYASATIAFNPTNNSLFMVGHDQYQQVAEISIPSPVNSTVMSNLPVASVLQNFADITEGNLDNLASGGAAIGGTHGKIGGLMVQGSVLIGSDYAYYGNGSPPAVKTHFTTSLNLAATGDFGGMYQVGSSGPALRAGFMTSVPAALQTPLGGPALTGQGGISVVSRTSAGPAAYSFDPSQLGVASPVPDSALLAYPDQHSTLGDPAPTSGTAEATSPFWSLATRIKGMVLVPGTKTLLYFGYHGLGPYCYGTFTDDPAQVSATGSASDVCYDPSKIGGKGPHEYPYIYQAWAYNTDDLAAAKIGTYTVTQQDYDSARFVSSAFPQVVLPVGSVVNPWNIKPYAVWKLPFAFAPSDIYGGSAAYDPATQNLYIASTGGDTSDLNKRPLIHAFHVDLAATPAAAYKVKGQAVLLKGSVTLQNGGSSIVVSSPDRAVTQPWEFPAALAVNSSYNVTATSQPAGQTCAVHRGTGTVDANADVENILVLCSGDGASSIAASKPFSGKLSGTIR